MSFISCREILEQVVRIVRAGRRFRMVLHAEYRFIAMAHAFNGVVVEVHVRDLDFASRAESRVDTEAMILRRDLDFAGLAVQHRVVCAMMTELQLVRFAAECETENLMAQADAEYGNLADQLADLRGLPLKRFGIARTVRKEDSVGIQRKHFFRAAYPPGRRSSGEPI